MKCNWCKNNLVDGDENFCPETGKYYCSESCKEKDLKEYLSSLRPKKNIGNETTMAGSNFRIKQD